MNYAIIIYVLGYIFNFSAGFMLLPGIVAIIYREQEGWWFLLSALIIVDLRGLEPGTDRL